MVLFVDRVIGLNVPIRLNWSFPPKFPSDVTTRCGPTVRMLPYLKLSPLMLFGLTPLMNMLVPPRSLVRTPPFLGLSTPSATDPPPVPSRRKHREHELLMLPTLPCAGLLFRIPLIPTMLVFTYVSTRAYDGLDRIRA